MVYETTASLYMSLCKMINWATMNHYLSQLLNECAQYIFSYNLFSRLQRVLKDDNILILYITEQLSLAISVHVGTIYALNILRPVHNGCQFEDNDFTDVCSSRSSK